VASASLRHADAAIDHMSRNNAPPGWYRQSDGRSVYWDGFAWAVPNRPGGHSSLSPGRPAVLTQPVRPSVSEDRSRGRGCLAVLLLVGAVVAAFVILPALLDESRSDSLPVVSLVIGLLIVVLVIVILARTVRIIPQARAGVVERLGRYHRTLNAGLSIVIPFVDRVRPLIDLREHVVSFAPQPVITEDNLVVEIDSVIYFSVVDPRAATYEIADYIQGVEQLTVTTLRNVVGGLDLERTLTSREQINDALRGVLDEATGKWGIRVSRVELKSIDPPPSVQQSMEKQMKAEREKRAAVLAAEGAKQSAILTAQGRRESAILEAEGDAQARVLRAEGESTAIARVFAAIHDGDADEQVLAYRYLQTLPSLGDGPDNSVWIVPAELMGAMSSLAGAFGDSDASSPEQPGG
jgi:regulator of protease activity HflC (stomatin/prohibitin superfamily)